MSLLELFLLTWLILSAGTLLFLSSLMGRAFLAGGLPAFRKLDIGFSVLVLTLLLSSLCWPWAWWAVRRMTRGTP